MGDDGDGGIGHREVDHDIGPRFADDTERHADFADAGDEAGVFAEQWVVGRFQCGDDLEARILAASAVTRWPMRPAAPWMASFMWDVRR